MSKKLTVLLVLMNFVFLGHVNYVRAADSTTNSVQAILVTPKPCTQDENSCNPSSCSYNPEKCKETPKICVIGQPCEDATPTTKLIKETYPLIYCGKTKTACSQSEYCYHEQTGESKCLPIKDNYCGGGNLENVYPIKQCDSSAYSCLPILLGSKENLPRVCIKILGGETKKAKVEIKEIPTNNGQPSYTIKTESVQVISKVKVETNEKGEIKAIPNTKKIPSPVIILNPDDIIDKLSVKPKQISLDASCTQLRGCKPIYEIATKNTVKFLGIIPVSYTSTLALDATTADQISESKPWFIQRAPFLFR
ncbi:hypothetical protein A3J19_02630 [Candidatus Daviesbacteria bacterium RIFCSPLOWO2_02_FULL_41_8]|uniref:Uncharacterized protein n=3 Tax=Candidatus Daviesiibacteriota TaxID=1752718 RepID=A0A1F5NM92_9BACT|nr:MAG: hypothetical protein A2871_03430 [Candidatus Daviesbacteria bacterium RIFCSPHIGHO2_01_FULL_41_23]OGE32455.1 MAG: hypothetical protein A3D83_02270 [Candidatus Daviesbacteria bacterium RIFCSPHIGHO2_02_FULL_41_10]OGE61975.1 MAG: hypothetical protein A2967_03245 [Candidatus Daviesbacteria bacterium RIFCSPLOWO2_01_FULL_41_32]OGE78500.1 MAG: hypothetical protein A3J19_02630 [Candidatus Daviesbacteria bacterium RIFCSPLOWO2_02_FULL_41_8]